MVILVLTTFTMTTLAQEAEIIFSKSMKETEQATEFKSGEPFYALVKFKKPISQVLVPENRMVGITVELYKGKSMIAEESFGGHDPDKFRVAKETNYILPIVSDLKADVFNLGKKEVTAVEMPLAFSRLAPGTHEIEFQLKSLTYKDGEEAFAKGKFTLINDNFSQAWFAKHAQDSRDHRLLKSGSGNQTSVTVGTYTVTVTNNCGKTMLIRKAIGVEKTQWLLVSGQKVKLSSALLGSLEQSNNGRWTSLPYLTPDDKNNANLCKK